MSMSRELVPVIQESENVSTLSYTQGDLNKLRAEADKKFFQTTGTLFFIFAIGGLGCAKLTAGISAGVTAGLLLAGLSWASYVRDRDISAIDKAQAHVNSIISLQKDKATNEFHVVTATQSTIHIEGIEAAKKVVNAYKENRWASLKNSLNSACESVKETANAAFETAKKMANSFCSFFTTDNRPTKQISSTEIGIKYRVPTRYIL